MADGRVIGKENKLPWHFSADLKNFKALTMGSTVMMGRKTFESIGKFLPGRENFVLSRSKASSSGENLYFFNSIKEALKNIRTPQAFVIGGAELFRQTMEQIKGIYLTRIHQKYEGDVFYPEIPNGFIEKEKRILQDNPKIEFIYLENVE